MFVAAEPLVSVIINNYNYGPFLGQAIDSALAQTYDRVEVVVVDDDSTDASSSVIAAYGAAIVPVFQANGGQASAFNAGFRHCHGEIVLFLDADDVLLPDTVTRVVDLFQRAPGLARVQYRLQVVNAGGVPTDAVIPPRYVPLPTGDLRGDPRGLVNRADQSPTSGNAFAAWALAHVLPMPEAPFRIGADYYLSRVTALLGPVASLDDVGGLYRVHAANHYFEPTLRLDRLRRHVSLTQAAYPALKAFAMRVGVAPAVAARLDDADEIYLAQRLVLLKLDPAWRSLTSDSLPWLVQRGAVAALRRPTLAPPLRLAHALWFVALALAPRPSADALAGLLLPETRPALNGLLAAAQRLGGRPHTHRFPGPLPLPALRREKSCLGQTVGGLGATCQPSPLPSGSPAPWAVVIVNYNTREHLRACLQTVQAEAPAEIVVVDNASTDGSAVMVRTEFPDVTLLALEVNRGYGAGANHGLRPCASPYALLLNSDTRLRPGALAALGAYLDQEPAAAVVGPRLVHPDGALQASCYPFPTALNTLLAESGVGPGLRRIPWLRSRYLPAWDHATPRRVPWVQGSALALRRVAWQSVGGFDESFFMYFEEVDLCYRLAQLGWETHFAPATTVIHYGGASASQQRVRMAVQMLDSTLRFGQRHWSPGHALALRGVVKGIVLARVIVNWARLRVEPTSACRDRWADNLTAWRQVMSGVSSR